MEKQDKWCSCIIISGFRNIEMRQQIPHEPQLCYQMVWWPSPFWILDPEHPTCPLNNVVANTALDILILNVQLVLQQLQFFQVVFVYLRLVPHQLEKKKVYIFSMNQFVDIYFQVEVRSKGNEDEDDGYEETGGNPSGNNVVAIRWIELHPADANNDITQKLSCR